MTGAINAYKVNDLDRALLKSLMDIIDYSYRFREDKDNSVEDVIESVKDNLDEKVSSFYLGIPDINFDISVEDYATEYKNTML